MCVCVKVTTHMYTKVKSEVACFICEAEKRY